MMSEWKCVCCNFLHTSKKELINHLKIIGDDIRETIYVNQQALEEISKQLKLVNRKKESNS